LDGKVASATPPGGTPTLFGSIGAEQAVERLPGRLGPGWVIRLSVVVRHAKRSAQRMLAL
jgi:hypothetical protein